MSMGGAGSLPGTAQLRLCALSASGWLGDPRGVMGAERPTVLAVGLYPTANPLSPLPCWMAHIEVVLNPPDEQLGLPTKLAGFDSRNTAVFVPEKGSKAMATSSPFVVRTQSATPWPLIAAPALVQAGWLTVAPATVENKLSVGEGAADVGGQKETPKKLALPSVERVVTMQTAEPLPSFAGPQLGADGVWPAKETVVV